MNYRYIRSCSLLLLLHLSILQAQIPPPDTLRFTGGSGDGFSAVTSLSACWFNQSSTDGDGFGIGLSTSVCAMNIGGNDDGYGFGVSSSVCAMNLASAADGYGFGTTPSVCVMNMQGLQDGYGIGLSPEICFFTGGPNDGFAVGRLLADDFCEVTKTRLYATPCGVRDNGTFCNRLTGAQVAAGEPSGIVWAADGIQNTLWFEFYPPSNGTFSIETVGSDFDTELAIYEADLVTNCPACQLASAESGGTGTNAKITLSCLDPSKKYYLQLDGRAGAVGTTSIRIREICPVPAYSGTDECGNTPTTVPSVYNFCITPNSAGATDPSAASMGTIAANGTSVCGQSLEMSLEHSTYLPIRLNSTQLQIDVTLNQSSCNHGFSVMVFQPASGNCPNPNQWGDSNNPLVGCFQGNGLGNVLRLTGLTPNTTFYVLVDGVQNDGGLLQLNIASFLPLTWLDFDGERKNNAHYLYWKTGSELNVSHFEMERSADGLHFEKIGQTAAVGNSTHEQSYSFIDHTPMLGHNYYRIQEVEMDGTATYSRVIILDNNSSFAETFSIYPNPALDEVFVRCNVPITENALCIEVYDMLGRRLINEWIHQPSQQIHRLLIGQLVAGAYFVKIRNAQQQILFQHKLIKQSN